MKTHLFALSVLAASTGAVAQSSVTVWGIADVAARHVSNSGVGSMQTIASGSNNTSRFGVRGLEDLGDGLQAGFSLESGLNMDTGANASSSVFWDRASYLFLKSNSLGEIRLGHDQTPVYRIWSAADPFGAVGVGSVVALYPSSSSTSPSAIFQAFGTNDRTATNTTRGNNMVIYSLPELGGVMGSAFATAGEGSTATTAARGLKQLGISGGYAKGPLSVMAGYARTNNPLGGSEKFEDRAVHVIYNFGMVKVSVAQRNYKFASATQEILEVGAWVPVGSGTIKASLGRLNNKGSVAGASIDARDVRSYGLGYVHDLSKRTALYGTVGLLDNASGSANTYSGGPTGMAAGGKSRGVELGVRHNF